MRTIIIVLLLVLLPGCVFTVPVYPHQERYYIRTRIIVESANGKVNGQDTPIYAIQPEQLKNEIAYAERLIPIKLCVAKVEVVSYNWNYQRFYQDAKLYPDYVSIYYMLPNSVNYNGLSNYPWSGDKGIYIANIHSDWTLAHELGHCFGLLHTFDEDWCGDTPRQTNYLCYNENIDPNCHNLMNYCFHDPKFLTPDQLKRIDDFLRSSRHNVVTFENNHDLNVNLALPSH